MQVKICGIFCFKYLIANRYEFYQVEYDDNNIIINKIYLKVL